MRGGRTRPGQHRPAPLVRSSSGEVWRLQPEPPLRRVSAQGVEDLGQELARLGHGRQRVGEVLLVEVHPLVAAARHRRSKISGRSLLVLAMACSVLAKSCSSKSITLAAAARHRKSKISAGACSSWPRPAACWRSLARRSPSPWLLRLGTGSRRSRQEPARLGLGPQRVGEVLRVEVHIALAAAAGCDRRLRTSAATAGCERRLRTPAATAGCERRLHSHVDSSWIYFSLVRSEPL